MSNTFLKGLDGVTRGLCENGGKVTLCSENIALAKKIAGEGMVLLENRGSVLPLKKGCRVSIFGVATLKYYGIGGGSGEGHPPYVRSIYDGLKDKESEGKVCIYEPVSDFYREKTADENEYITGGNYGSKSTPEPEVPDALICEAAKNSDVAIVAFRRFSCENEDRLRGDETRGFYLTTPEKNLISGLKTHFKTIVAVLNYCAVSDVSWIKNDEHISAALISWLGGMEGGAAVSDILCGDTNPSGKLADTLAEQLSDYPSDNNFDNSVDFTDYEEDIYVGYRYFETIPGVAEKVCYPFGYGLSYTAFEFSNPIAQCVKDTKEEEYIKIDISVRNTGSTAGKEVVQVYYSAPRGKLGCPARQLAAFRKTKLLLPGEIQKITLEFPANDMASFDDTGKVCKGAFVLEKGNYKFYIGSSVRDTVKADYEYKVETDYIVAQQLSSLLTPEKLQKRLLADGSYEKLSPRSEPLKNYQPTGVKATAPAETVMFSDVPEKASPDEFIAQMTDDELIANVAGQPSVGNCVSDCFAGCDRLGIPSVPTSDGPAAIRSDHIQTTLFPCGTLVACTWNPVLAEKMGIAAALEAKENGLGIWLAPGVNIHRHPLCGRNFEYYSEDPLLAGKSAAGVIKGCQSQGIAATIKHFACNNREVNRNECDSRVSERALREIYLRVFEIAIKDAAPWALMTSYNKLNGHYTSEEGELICGILRGEWGYEGMITTDWGNTSNHIKEQLAANDLKMPTGQPDELKASLESGEISRAQLEDSVKNILKMIKKLG